MVLRSIDVCRGDQSPVKESWRSVSGPPIRKWPTTFVILFVRTLFWRQDQTLPHPSDRPGRWSKAILPLCRERSSEIWFNRRINSLLHFRTTGRIRSTQTRISLYRRKHFLWFREVKIILPLWMDKSDEFTGHRQRDVHRNAQMLRNRPEFAATHRTYWHRSLLRSMAGQTGSHRGRR